MKDGKVSGWAVGKGATIEAEGENHFLRLKVGTAGEAVMVAAEEAVRVKEAARIAALPKPKPQVAAPAAEKLPAEIHVVGNELKTAEEKSVWLQGVAIPSLEWSAGGDHILQSIGVAI